MFNRLRRAIGILGMIIFIFRCVVVLLILFIGGEIDMRR